jgi:hypothetical protein
VSSPFSVEASAAGGCGRRPREGKHNHVSTAQGTNMGNGHCRVGWPRTVNWCIAVLYHFMAPLHMLRLTMLNEWSLDPGVSVPA